MNPTDFSHLIPFVIQLIVLGFLVACLELTFQMFMQPNMILFPWAVLLSKIAHKNEVMRHLMRPFGRCRYCNATWVAFYVYVYFYGYNLPVLLIVGITTLFVRILSDSRYFATVDPNDHVDQQYVSDTVTDTPWQAMMWAYLILGSFYGVIYVVIPILL